MNKKKAKQTAEKQQIPNKHPKQSFKLNLVLFLMKILKLIIFGFNQVIGIFFLLCRCHGIQWRTQEFLATWAS